MAYLLAQFLVFIRQTSDFLMKIVPVDQERCLVAQAIVGVRGRLRIGLQRLQLVEIGVVDLQQSILPLQIVLQLRNLRSKDI